MFLPLLQKEETAFLFAHRLFLHHKHTFKDKNTQGFMIFSHDTIVKHLTHSSMPYYALFSVQYVEIRGIEAYM